jgi:cell division protein FtsQ
MDGGGRLLRSLSALAFDLFPGLTLPRLAAAGSRLAVSGQPPALPDRRGLRAARRQRLTRLRRFVEAHPRFLGLSLATFLFATVSACGLVYGGEYAAFVERNGTLPDCVARLLGFGIDAVTISGMNELNETDVLAIGGISPKRSLLFLDAADVRRRLKERPLVEDASVTKLFPNRILISIVERVPYGLWQKDGDVSIIGADGQVIDTRHDDHFDRLPFVAGEGANAHIGDYVKLLAAAGDLRAKIRAGAWIADRRWNLVMTSGITVMLPEDGALAAVAELARLEANDHILDKDIVSIDLRMPNRIIARLTDQAAAARTALQTHKPAKRGGST